MYGSFSAGDGHLNLKENNFFTKFNEGTGDGLIITIN